MIREPEYPQRLQHRAYSGRRALSLDDVFLAGAKNLDPRQLLDRTSSTTLGPPVVALRRRATGVEDDFLCVVGNHRVLLTDIARSSFPARLRSYYRSLKWALPRFGLSAAEISESDQPVLVRVLDGLEVDESDAAGQSRVLAELGHLNRRSDGSFTKARDPASLGFVYARELLAHRSDTEGRRVMHWLIDALIEYGSARELLDSDGGAQLLAKLVALDVVPREELMLFQRPTDHRPTALGSLCLRSMLYALAFDDPDILDGSDPRILSRLEASLGHLLAVRGKGVWDIAPHVGRACTLIGKFSDPFGKRRHTSGRGRRTHFAELDAMSALHGASLFADRDSLREAELKDLAFARAFAGIFLCEAKHQSGRALARCFDAWRVRASVHDDQFSLGVLDGTDLPHETVIEEVFCRLPDVARWVRQQLTPPFDPTASRAEQSLPPRVHRGGRSVPDRRLTYQEALQVWARISEAAMADDGAVDADASKAPHGRRRGRPARYSDAEVFGACAIRVTPPPLSAEASIPGVSGPSARQCRRRVRAWKRNPSLWSAICAALPQLAIRRPGRRR